MLVNNYFHSLYVFIFSKYSFLYNILISNITQLSEFSEFRRQPLKEIYLINLKLNDLMSNVNILVKKVRYADEPELNDDTNTAVKTLIQSFPVVTEQELMSMEE